MDDNAQEPSRKRRRLSNEVEDDSVTDSHEKVSHSALGRPISPPPLRRAKKTQSPKVMQSPFQLTWIRDLPESSNVDAVSLRDILGDPLIAECWEFNYLHDLDFLMEAFDQDVRDMVKVHVVHGFWKNEDQSRLALKVSTNLCCNTERYIH
jgi:tyrosyl-DNA phosphodiesterase 1